jgi:hypothetical protein
MFGTENEIAYWSKLNDVAHDITELLKNLQAESEEKGSEPTQISSEEKIKVYLAETSYELNEYRENIKRELQEHGLAVFPDKSLPLVANIFTNSVQEMMDKCDLTVHLIGNNYGIVPDGTSKSTVVLQNEVAVNVCNTKKTGRLIWLPTDLAPEDNRQIQFIEELKHNEEFQKGADLMESSLEDFKYTIHNKIKAIKASRQNPEPVVKIASPTQLEGGPKMVYLVCDQEDLANTAELEDLLFNEGYDVIVPVFDGEESQIRLDHQENLKTCDAVLIYYGAGNELWMRSKTRELLKIAGYGRSRPLQAKGIILAAPNEDYKKRIRAHDTIIIDCFDGISKDKIVPFIEKVNQVKI